MGEGLQVEAHEEAGLVCLQLRGVIDEQFDPAPILNAAAPLTILDVSQVRRITSFGVRRWTEAMRTVPPAVKHLYLVHCQPVFVDQLSMVLNFAGRAEVVSAFAAFVCESCGDEILSLLDLVGDRGRITAGQLDDVECPRCKKPAQLGDDPRMYTRLVTDFGAKAIDPQALSLLERLGLYEGRKQGRHPEATKLVHERITLFRLSGMLDGRFRQKRLASGVEGDVVFDLSEIAGIDAVGAERWTELLGELGNATSISLVDVPDVLLRAIADGLLSVKGSGLHSYRATFQCGDCGNLDSRTLRADEPLAACTRPCGRCGRSTSPLTDTNLIEEVLRHARPASIAPAVEMMIRDRHEILERAQLGNAAPGPSATPSDSLARYRVIKPLSEGGMAEIFLAVHQGIAGFEKLVVLKKILRKMLERRQVAVQLFLNEAKIAANLNHPNIVQTFEVGEHGGDLFIAMEYIHGVDVRRLIRQSLLQREPLPTEEVLYVIERVAAGLHHAHTAKDLSGRSLNVVHRDVSPSNIILGFDGQVKLLDFGVATAAATEGFDGVIGKFSYMSPEQLARVPLDGRSDVFGLGVVLHELLARRPLFKRESDHETVRAVLHSNIPSLAPEVPDFVDTVVQTALARRREDRYPDARAFQLAIEECLRRLGNMPNEGQVAQTLRRLFPTESEAPAFDPSLYRSSGSDGLSPTPPPYRLGEHSRSPLPGGDRTLVNAAMEMPIDSAALPLPAPDPPFQPARSSSQGMLILPPLTPPPRSIPPMMRPPPSLPPQTGPLPPELVQAAQARAPSRDDRWLIVAAVVVFVAGLLLLIL